MEQPIRVERSAIQARVVLSSAVNLFVVTELHGIAVELLAAGLPVVVDCLEVTHLDGAVCQVLLALRRDLRDKGADLTLVGVPETVARFLRRGGMHDLVREVAA